MTEPLTAEDLLFPEDTLAPEVRRNYITGWAEYTSWCDRSGVPALPAGPETVAEFTRWLGWEWTPDGQPAPPGVQAGKSASSLERALQAIRVAHMSASAVLPDREMPDLDLREAWAAVAERKALGSPRGPGRPRLGYQGAQDALTVLRDTAVAQLVAGGEVSLPWLTALSADEVAAEGDAVEMVRYGVGIRVTSEAAAEAVGDWLEALRWAAATHGPLFPRIRRGKVTDEPLLVNEIVMIAREQEVAGAPA